MWSLSWKGKSNAHCELSFKNFQIVKYLFVIVIVVVPLIAFTQQPTMLKDSVNNAQNEDSTAKFPGGLAAFSKFLIKNINYPPEARAHNIQGVVIAQFFVNEDGSVSDVKIIESLGYGCDEEFLRVIDLMPCWNPGIKNGVPIKSFAHLSYPFRPGK